LKGDSCIRIESLAYPVFIGPDPWKELGHYLDSYLLKGGIFLLADHNTNKHCLPVLLAKLPGLARCPVFLVRPGERSKNLRSLERIWQWMIENDAARDSLLLNLGGGVVSDLGGFAAATYRRGIKYINIPTSLTGQADASIGGKTALNISGIKNQAGLFYDPLAVFICPAFLDTLPKAHFISGFAEIIKCAILSGNGFWLKMKNHDGSTDEKIHELIAESAAFKCGIVKSDPFELAARKILNFGHTVGHALESLSFMPGRARMLHGEAVAAGMICEAYLSYETAGLHQSELDEIRILIGKTFSLRPVESHSYQEIMNMISHDKKKFGGSVGFSLISGAGKPVFDKLVTRDQIIRSFEYYNSLIKP
jgi:3-dehydroquinate synthase